MQQLVDYLCKRYQKLSSDHRYMLGIVGVPGAGKSTLAERLVGEINRLIARKPAIVVPMDGFHFSNDVLDERNLRPLKGTPETFDVIGFIDLLKAIRHAPAARVGCPAFHRDIDGSIQDAIVVEPEHQIIVVEGNYLLLQRPPWDQVRHFFDEVWYLDVSEEIILPRLMQRHIQGGRNEDGARAKVDCTDLPNARLIRETLGLSHKIVRALGENYVVSQAVFTNE